jgi:uncharacterized protein YkwD
VTFREWLLTLLDRRRPAPRPLPPPPPPDADLVNMVMIRLHNDYRAEGRIGALKPSDKLNGAARLVTDDNAARQTGDHTTADGRHVDQRVTGLGYRWRAIGENVAWWQAGAAQAFTAWINSPGHLRNIVNPDYIEAGFAMSRDAQGRCYWCAVFARPATLMQRWGLARLPDAELLVSCPPPLGGPHDAE